MTTTTINEIVTTTQPLTAKQLIEQLEIPEWQEEETKEQFVARLDEYNATVHNIFRKMHPPTVLIDADPDDNNGKTIHMQVMECLCDAANNKGNLIELLYAFEQEGERDKYNDGKQWLYEVDVPWVAEIVSASYWNEELHAKFSNIWSNEYSCDWEQLSQAVCDVMDIYYPL